MNLYDRDFSTPNSKEEVDALEAEKQWEAIPGIKTPATAPRFAHADENVRDFLWHARSLFPNNHLNPISIKKMDLVAEATAYTAALDSASNETAIQTYIKSNRKWFIPAALFRDFNFGHHDSYLFPEQRLGSEYQVDYMLLGKNSDGYSIVLVEFEDVNVAYKLSTSNSESASVRKGLSQINDWKRWMDNNRSYFLNSFGLTSRGITVPSSRIYYALVVSRRKYHDETGRDIRSQTMHQTPNLKIVSYDRLADNILRFAHGY